MLYSLIRPLLKLTLSVYFRKIYISGTENVPADKPVVFAANHPSAFIEPVILACWQKRPLSYMARGDLYLNSPFIRWLYQSFRLIPIYRLDDAGYSQVKSNYSSIDHCAAALERRGGLVILAEGRTKHEKRLRPIMKGTARVVFTTMQNYDSLDIHIVPVGVNYSNSDRFREVAMIDIGPPIRVADFKDTYQERPAAAINTVTQAIREGLSERVVHIQDPADDDLADLLLDMQLNHRSEDLLRVLSSDKSVLEHQLALTQRINALPTAEKARLKDLVASYREDLETAGVTDRGLCRFRSGKSRSLAAILPGYLLFLASLPFNLPPWLFSYQLTRKLVKAIEFRASVLYAAVTISYLAYWLLCMAVFIALRQPVLVAAAIIFPLTGYFSIIYLDYWRDWKAAYRVGRLGRTTQDKLWKQREEILRKTASMA